MARKILIAEDEEDLLEFLAMRLEANGYDVIQARNGKDALERIKNTIPDLFLMDVFMPEVDGVDLFEKLRSNPRTAKVPIIVMTSGKHMEKNFRILGVTDFIGKPIDPAVLLQKISQALKGKDPSSSAKGRLLSVVVSRSEDFLNKVRTVLKGLGVDVLKCEDAKAFDKKLAELSPGLVVVDLVQLDGQVPMVLRRWRKSGAKAPVFLCHDFESLKDSSASVNALKMEIEKAKVACLDAGANKALGQLSPTGLEGAVKERVG